MREYVETWKAICARLNRSERWCRLMASRPEHPLPVGAVAGVVRLYLDDLEAWERAEFEASRARAAAGESLISQPARFEPLAGHIRRRGRGIFLRTVSVSRAYHKAFALEALRQHRTVRALADELINRALDEAGAP